MSGSNQRSDTAIVDTEKELHSFLSFVLGRHGHNTRSSLDHLCHTLKIVAIEATKILMA